MDYIQIFIMLIGAHALCDYPLQGEFLALAKNRYKPLPGVPWWQAMTAHCVIHGTAVSVITGIWWIGVLEFAIHFVTDEAKCRGNIGYNTDQAIHVLCKFVWWLILIYIIKT